MSASSPTRSYACSASSPPCSTAGPRLARQVLSRSGGALRAAGLRAACPEVDPLRRGTGLRSLGAAACTDLGGCGGVPLAVYARLRRHAERLTWRARRGDKSPDPLGKRRSLRAVLRESGPRTGEWHRGNGGVAGGEACAVLECSDRPEPTALATSGNPLAERGAFTVECQRCGQTSHVGVARPADLPVPHRRLAARVGGSTIA